MSIADSNRHNVVYLTAECERLRIALRHIQVHAAEPLRAENRPGYELREFCEEVHAMAASALSSAEPVKNEAGYQPGSCAHCGQFHSTAVCPPQNV